MKKSAFLALAASTVYACGGDATIGIESESGSVKSGLVTQIDPTPTTQTINEGDAANFSLDSLCSTLSTESVTVDWDFGTTTGPADELSGTVATKATDSATAGDACATGTDFAADWSTASDPTLQQPSFTYANDGTFTVNVVATDSQGDQSSSLSVTVNNVVVSTTLEPPTGTTREGLSYNFTGTATDPGSDSDEITWVVWDWGDGSPQELFECGTDANPICDSPGRSEVRAHTFPDNSTYTVQLRICDDSYSTGDLTDFGSTPAGCDDASASQIIENNPPTPSLITSAGTVNEGSVIGFTWSYTDTGEDEHDIEWDFQSDQSGPGASMGATTDAGGVFYDDDGGDGASYVDADADTISTNPAAGNFAPTDILTPNYEYCDQGAGSSSRTVRVTVFDDDDGSASVTRNITVNDIDPNLTLTPDATTIDEGQNVVFTAVATSDSDDCDPIDGNSYVWNCGGGSVVSGCSSSDTTCECNYADGGLGGTTYTASVEVSDEDSSTVQTQDILVNNVAPTVDPGTNDTVDEGASYTFNGSFTDPANTNDAYLITWEFGDGNTVTGNLSPTHIYQEQGSYTAALTVNDQEGGITREEITITVTDVNPSVDTINVSPSTIDEGNGVTLAVSFSSGADLTSADPLTSYTVNWGDGTTENFTLSGGAASVSPTHTYTDDDLGAFASDYGITVTVFDEDSNVSDSSQLVEVLNVNPTANPPTVSNANPIEGETITFEATWSDPSITDTYTVSWDFGDVAGPTNSIAANTFIDSGVTHKYVDSGSYDVTYTINDGDGTDVTSGILTITVDEVAPVIAGVSAPDINEGDTVTLTVTADSGTGDAGLGFGNTSDDLTTYDFDCDNDGTYEVSNSASANTGTGDCTFVQDSSDQLGGTYTVGVRVCDEEGDPDCTDTTHEVLVNNVAPALTLPADPATIFEGDTTDISGGTFTDPGDDSWTAYWTFTDPQTGASVQLDTDGAGGSSPGPSGIGTSESYLFVDDESGANPVRTVCATLNVEDDDTVTSTGCYNITIANLDPTIVGIDTTSPVGEGTAMVFNVTADDVGNDAGPFDPFTYTYNWGDGTNDTVVANQNQASHIFDGQGSFTVTITVEDDDGGSVTDTVEVEVINIPPEIIDVFQSGPKPENSEISVQPVLRSYNVGTLVFEYDWGEGNGFENCGGTCDPVGEHVYTQDGVYTVQVRVTDDAGDSDVTTIPVNITNVAPAVSVSNPAPVSEGSSATLEFSATDASPDDNGALSFSVDWDADGVFTNVTPTALGGGNYSVTSPVYTDDGVRVTRIRVADDDTFSEAVSSVTVTNAAPVIQNTTVGGGTTEGSTTTLDITASDDGADDGFVYEIDWDNDGTFDTVASSASTSFQGTHVYGDEGAQTINIRVRDDDGASDNATESVTITNVAPTITLVDASTPINRNSNASVKVEATDPGDDVLTYEWDFDDDGVFEQSSTTSTTAFDTYASVGVKTVNVRVSDGTDSVTDSVNITVTTPDAAVTVSATSPVDEGSDTTVSVTPNGAEPYDIVIDWGDGTPDGGATGVSAAALPYTEPHTYVDSGTYTVEITVTDALGVVAASEAQVRVTNLAPTITSAVVSTTLTEGDSFSATVTATDPAGVADPLTFSLVNAPAGMTIGEVSGTVSWVPGYESAGSNLFEVMVADGDGGMATQAWDITVDFIDGGIDAGGAADGLPDNWEQDNFGGDVDPNADPDNDGLTNLEEYLAGTDPNTSNAPGRPVELSPVDRTVGTLRPTLVASNTTDPDGDVLSYIFQVYDNPDWIDDGTDGNLIFEGTVTQGDGNTSITLDVDLEDAVTYYWRVQASDGTATGEWSDGAEFDVDTTNSAPFAPVTVLPADTATVRSLTPYLEVTPVTDPDGDVVTYNFVIYADAGLTTEVASATGRALPNWFVDTDLEDGEEYFWVATATDGDLGADSNVASFTVESPVNTPPSPPTIESPIDGADVTSATPVLTVINGSDEDGDTLEYFFEVATNPGFAGGSLQSSGPVAESSATTSFEVPTALMENVTYYWRARASDGAATSEWVASSFFVNTVNDAPSAPIALGPENTVSSAPTELVVVNSEDPEGAALTYTFELLSDDGETVLETGEEVAEGSADTTAYALTTSLEPGVTYFWRARASDGDAVSENSRTLSFTIFDAELLREDIANVSSEVDGVRDEVRGIDTGCAASQPSVWMMLVGLVALLGARALRRRKEGC